jgi:hypothetical protein
MEWPDTLHVSTRMLPSSRAAAASTTSLFTCCSASVNIMVNICSETAKASREPSVMLATSNVVLCGYPFAGQCVILLLHLVTMLMPVSCMFPTVPCSEVVMESLERFVMLATSNDITRAAIDHGHVSHTTHRQQQQQQQQSASHHETSTSAVPPAPDSNHA